MKKIFALLVAVMCCVTILAVSAEQMFAVLDNDGHMVPDEPSVETLLSKGSGERLPLVKVTADQELYQTMLKYYIYASRETVDVSYPMYINNGTTLKFLDEEVWLVSDGLDLLTSYDGLYLANGSTYNADLSQADGDEFILLSLDNGLYMNAQDATFSGTLGDIFIPRNSIIKFDHSYLRFYSYDNGVLAYDEEEVVQHGTITIGDNSYGYTEFLNMLGILEEIIDKKDKGQDTEELLEELEPYIEKNQNQNSNKNDSFNFEIAEVIEALGLKDDFKQNPDGSWEYIGEATEPGELGELGEMGDLGQLGAIGNIGDKTELKDVVDTVTGGNLEEGELESLVEGLISGEDVEGLLEELLGDSESHDKAEESSEAGKAEGEGKDKGKDEQSGTDDNKDDDGSNSDLNIKEDQDEEDELAEYEDADGDEEVEEDEGDVDADVEGDDITDNDQNDSDDNEDDDEEDKEEEEEEEEEGQQPTDKPDTSGGQNRVPKPVPPEVSMSNFEEWAYAIKAEIEIDNPGKTLKKGVNISVFADIEGVTTPIGNYEGMEVYDKTKTYGDRTLLRKTFYSSGDAVLATLESNTEVYIQYRYNYTNVNTTDPDNPTLEIITEYSPIYKTKTKTIAESDIPNMIFDGDIKFATSSDTFTIENLTVKNDTDYDPELDTFENYKKNILPFITKLEIILTPIYGNGESKTITVSGSTLLKAQQNEGGITYISPRGLVDSNTEYAYTFKASDKYKKDDFGIILQGNLDNNTIFTAKECPEVSITTITNTETELVIDVEITDQDNAIISEDGISIKALAGSRESIFTGNMLRLVGSNYVVVKTFTDTSEIKIDNPKDGEVYRITITNLPYSISHKFSALGGYTPQPDSPNATETLDPIHNQVFGTASIYTATLPYGIVDFRVSRYNITDFSAQVTLRMDDGTWTNVLPLVDKYAIKFTDETGKVAVQVDLLKDELEALRYGDGYTYDPKTGSVRILEDSYLEKPVIVEIFGTEDKFVGKNLWEAIQYSTDENEVPVDPASISITIPSNATEATSPLDWGTQYVISVDAITVKSEIEYKFNTTLSSINFKTKKKYPEIKIDEISIVNDIFEFKNIEIVDEGDTILSDGKYKINLIYNGETTLQSIYLDTNGTNLTTDTLYESLKFEGLTPGLPYTIQIIANEYNDDDGFSSYVQNKVLWTADIIAGSDISGKVDITYLEYENSVYEQPIPFKLSGEYIKDAMSGEIDPNKAYENINADFISDELSHWTAYGNGTDDRYYTPKISLDKLEEEVGFEIGYVALKDYVAYNGKTATSLYMYQYKEGAGGASASGYNYSIYGYSDPTFRISIDDTSTIRFLIYDEEHLCTDGLEIMVYPKADEQWYLSHTASTGEYKWNEEIFETDFIEQHIVENKNINTESGTEISSTTHDIIKGIPVSPGEVFWNTGEFQGSAYFYNEDGSYVGRGVYTFRSGCTVTVPEGAATMTLLSHHTFSPTLYKISSSPQSTTYTAKFDIEVEDNKEFLKDSTVELRLYQSETINNPTYDTAVGNIISIPVVSKTVEKDGVSRTYHTISDLDSEKIIKSLEPNSSYRIELIGLYANGTETLLDYQDFVTDAPTKIIRNCEDFAQITADPFGNYLVTEDFELNFGIPVVFYGTIDFDGHVVTVKENRTMFGTIGESAVVKNMVVDFEVPLYYEHLIDVSYGLMENIIVRVNQNIQMGDEDHHYGSLLVQYLRSGAVLRNFIVKLDHDVDFTYSDRDALVVYASFGATVEQGYIFSRNNAGVLFGESLESGGFSSYANQSVYKNIYTVYDSWFSTDATSSGAVSARNYGALENMYHVGDMYVEDGGAKLKITPLDTRRVYYPSLAYSLGDTWHITNNKYDPYNGNDKGNSAGLEMLKSIEWQESVLNEGFVIKQNVEMGFYPRLTFPTCMAKYQDYNELPNNIVNQTPKIILDESLSKGVHTDGTPLQMKFTLENKAAYKITEIVIDGLDCTIAKQEPVVLENGQNVYEVTALLSLPEVDAEYLSKYTVTNIICEDSKGTKVVFNSNYETQNVEFYKEVYDAAGWSAINNQMTWNYWISEDISFTGQREPSIMLNGSESLMSTTTQFKGKIDGGQYNSSGELVGMNQLKNFTINSTPYPYIIYQAAYGAEFTNFIIDNMNITCGSAPKYAYAGFVGYTSTNVSFDNVHVTNSSINAGGYMGSLVGQNVTTLTIKNCSVTDTELTKNHNKHNVAIGGLVGYSNGTGSFLTSCYTRNVNITALDMSSSYGVGGLGGYSKSTATNCYANGTIIADGDKIGGLFGMIDASNATGLTNSISMVEIDTTGSQVGGLIGHNANANDFRTRNSLVVSDIMSTGQGVNRNVGMCTSLIDPVFEKTYAYEKQNVTGIADGELSDAYDLISGSELRTYKAWIDTIKLGTAFDYTKVSDGFFPKIYMTNGVDLVYNQQDIAIPGDASIELSYEEGTGKISANQTEEYRYSTTVKITSLADSISDIETAINNGQAQIVIDGMDQENAQNYDYDIELSAFEPNVMYVTIKTKNYTKAFDKYVAYLTYKGQEYKTIVDYSAPIYWNIYDKADFEFYATNHGTTVENFKIYGMIDYQNQKPQFSGLKIGRLEGIGPDTSGFKNIFYNTTVEDNASFIYSVMYDVSGLSFENIKLDYSKISLAKNTAGFIDVVRGDIFDVTLSGFDFALNSNYMTYAGFFGECNGNIYNVDILPYGDQYVESPEPTDDQVGYTDGYVFGTSIKVISTGTSGSRVAGLCGLVGGVISDISARDILVDCPVVSYVGGLVGQTNATADPMSCQNIDIKDISVTGKVVAGGIVAHTFVANDMKDFTAENVNIVATEGHAGAIAGYGGNTYNMQNLTVKNSSTTGTLRVGAMFGSVSYYYASATSGFLVENCKITGGTQVGGIAGFCEFNIYDALVVGCEIDGTVETTSTETPATGGAAGVQIRSGACKNTVIKDTSIIGKENVGGIFGGNYYDSRYTYVYSSFVHDDVTVTSLGDNAGGVVGSTVWYRLISVASGATVEAYGNNAGGFIGATTEILEANLEVEDYMYGCYFNGSVKASTNVSALIGRVYEGAKNIDVSTFRTVFAGSLDAGEENGIISLTAVCDTPGTTQAFGEHHVYEKTLVEGMPLDELLASGNSAVIVPNENMLITADRMREESLYTAKEYGGRINSTNLTEDGNIYMPYMTDYDDTSKIVPYTNVDYYDETQADGILLPGYGKNTDATVVYPSGIDTINIEATKSVTVIYQGVITDYDMSGDTRVVTLPYNYIDDITVDGVIYTANDLARLVLLNSDQCWYFEEDGDIMYGDYVTITDQAILAPVETDVNIVHMWQGKALDSNGVVYYLSNGKLYENTSYIPYTGGESRALYDYAQYNIHTYYNFSTVSGTAVDYRVYNLENIKYLVSPSLGYQADSFMLSKRNMTDVYFINLLDGQLIYRKYSPNMGDGFINNQIAYTSNSYNNAETIGLVRYINGDNYVINYNTGEILYQTPSGDPGLLSFAETTFSNAIDNFTGKNELLSEEGYADGEQVLEIANSEESQSLGESVLGNTLGGDSKLEGLNEVLKVAQIAENQNIITNEQKEESLKENNQTGQSNDDESSSSLTGEQDKLSGIPKTATYVAGSGLYSDGQLVQTVDVVSYAANVGVFIGDTLAYVENPYVEKTDGEISLIIATELENEYTLAYNKYTDEYEVFDVKEAAFSDNNSDSGKLTSKNSEILNKALEDDPEFSLDKFSVKKSAAISLTENEQFGFVLLFVIGMFAVIILSMLYVKLFRKNK